MFRDPDGNAASCSGSISSAGRGCGIRESYRIRVNTSAGRELLAGALFGSRAKTNGAPLAKGYAGFGVSTLIGGRERRA